MLQVKKYLGRQFSLTHYNCWHLARDVWHDLTGTDLGDRTPARITTAALVGTFDKDVPAAFDRLPAATSPCLVLMRRAGEVPHVGVFIDGRLLQMDTGGVTYLPLDRATTGFPKEGIGFYKPCG